MTTANNIVLFSPGRLVQGDLYTPQDKDMQGGQLVIKTGPNAGKPRVNYFFAVAIPKTRANWWEEAWGVQVLAIATAAWPRGETQNPRFSWKIEDGDSQTPNENNRKNADREGHLGNWILKFGSSFPTKVVDEQGAPLLEAGLVKRGFWIEVYGSAASNENQQKPGIYLNHNYVAFRGRDKEIVTGPDPRAIGFGRSAVPGHVTMAPVGATNFPAAVPGVPGVPTILGNVPPPATSAVFTPPPTAPLAVQPHPGFIAPPAAGAYPAPPPSTPMPPAAVAPPPAAAVDPLGAPAGHRMVNGAGPRYESYRQQGWTDAQLLQNGHMVRL